MTEDKKYWRESALDFIIGTGSFFQYSDIDAYRRETILSFHKYALSDHIFLIRKVDANAEYVVVSSRNELTSTFTNTSLTSVPAETENFFIYSNITVSGRFHAFEGCKSVIKIPLYEKNFEGSIYLAWNSEFLVTEGYRLFINICITRIKEMVRLSVAYRSLDELTLKFNVVFNSVSTGIIYTDNNGKSAWLNPRAKQILELDDTEENTAPVVVSEKMKKLHQKAENAEEILKEATLLFSEPGKELRNWIWKFPEQVFKVTCSPVSSEYVKGRLWLFEDISEIYFANQMLNWYNKQLEEINNEIKDNVEHLSTKNQLIAAQNDEIIAKNNKLEKINQEKDDLIAIVSHDLKTPLAQIQGFIQLLEKDTPQFSERQKFSLEKINSVTNRGLSLINEILDIQSAEQNITLNTTVFELSAWVSSEIENFNALALSKNIRIMYHTDSDSVFIQADKIHLSRILDNLVSNAIKFSDINSYIHVGLRVQDNRAILSIRDHGQGMSESDLKHLFQKFKKLSSRSTAGESSSGLGLSIVKKLVESMQGEIHCSSEKGKGTVFEVSLPTWQG